MLQQYHSKSLHFHGQITGDIYLPKVPGHESRDYGRGWPRSRADSCARSF
jgi:hypothetical protein